MKSAWNRSARKAPPCEEPEESGSSSSSDEISEVMPWDGESPFSTDAPLATDAHSVHLIGRYDVTGVIDILDKHLTMRRVRGETTDTEIELYLHQNLRTCMYGSLEIVLWLLDRNGSDRLEELAMVSAFLETLLKPQDEVELNIRRRRAVARVLLSPIGEEVLEIADRFDNPALSQLVFDLTAPNPWAVDIDQSTWVQSEPEWDQNVSLARRTYINAWWQSLSGGGDPSFLIAYNALVFGDSDVKFELNQTIASLKAMRTFILMSHAMDATWMKRKFRTNYSVKEMQVRINRAALKIIATAEDMTVIGWTPEWADLASVMVQSARAHMAVIGSDIDDPYLDYSYMDQEGATAAFRLITTRVPPPLGASGDTVEWLYDYICGDPDDIAMDRFRPASFFNGQRLVLTAPDRRQEKALQKSETGLAVAAFHAMQVCPEKAALMIELALMDGFYFTATSIQQTMETVYRQVREFVGFIVQQGRPELIAMIPRGALSLLASSQGEYVKAALMGNI